MPLIVGVEARVALLANRGWARYASELLAELARVADVHLRVLAPDNDCGRALAARLATAAGAATARADVVLAPFAPPTPDAYWSGAERGRSFESWIGAVDLLHSLTRFVPPTACRPIVATVHDVAPLSSPPFKPAYRAATIDALRCIVDARASIIAVSEFTRGELETRAGLDTRDVVVVPNGVGAVFHETSCASGASPHAGAAAASSPYLLYVGGAGPNKNLGKLLRAAEELHARRGVTLVVAGDPSWGWDQTIARGTAPWLKYAGYVGDRELAALYRGATALVCPSLHEGFGLPLVEAMACGAPVVCSAIPVFEEVAADAATYVDPHDVASLVAGLLRVVDDPAHARLLAARGRARAPRFSWRAAAKATVDVYRRAVAAAQ